MKDMIVIPRMSEKAYAQATGGSTYVFLVPQHANRHTVKQAIEAQFEVSVEAVNVLQVKGKVKRTWGAGGKLMRGARNDQKKAYVRLKAGDSIPVFAAVEAEEAEDKEKK